MEAIVYIATSLDGFIARENGAIDWLARARDEGIGEDYGYDAFFQSVDALVMGRNTYELVRTFGQWPYGAKPVIVLTTRPVEIPKLLVGTVETDSGSPTEVMDRLANRGMERVYVDGGRTIQGFMNDGLIHRMIISRLPVLIGTGIPLFGPVPTDLELRHIETRAFSTGLVQSEYELLTANSV